MFSVLMIIRLCARGLPPSSMPNLICGWWRKPPTEDARTSPKRVMQNSSYLVMRLSSLECHSKKEAAVVTGRVLVERRQTIAVEMFGLPAVGEGAAEPVEVMADPVQNATLANLLCNAN